MSWSSGGASSPRKGLNLSAKSSPRRLPARSPSELTPFSFSEDSLKILAADIERQNGKIPLQLPLRTGSVPSTPSLQRTYSQPRTPNNEYPPPINMSTPLGTPPSTQKHYPLSGSLSCGAQSSLLGGGSLGTPGKTVRDYEESFKEMKKENFNLKLRIFFLEERMGRTMQRDQVVSSNIDLKVQLEGCKQEIKEKDALLQEATNALDILEQKLQNSEIRRQSDLDEMRERLVDNAPKFELGPPRKSLKSPDVGRKLLSPSTSRKPFPFQEDNNANNLNITLEILEEQDEVSDTSGIDCLVQKNDASIRKIQSDLSSKEREIATLNISMKDKTTEISKLQQLLQKHKEEATRLLTSLQNKEDIIQNKDIIIASLEQRVGDPAIKHMNDEIEFKNQELQELQSEMRKREGKIRELESKIRQGFQHKAHCDKQIQTDLLAEDAPEKTKKLEEQLRLQTQERKLLLKRIHMLREQSGQLQADGQPEAEQPRTENHPICRTNSAGSDLGVQCDLGHHPVIVQERAYLGHVKRYRTSIAALRKRLAASTDACDSLREQLESLLEAAERVSMDTESGDELRRMIVVSRDLSRSIGTSLISSLEHDYGEVSSSSSDDSTWNLELPNIADLNLGSETDHTGEGREDDLSAVESAPEFCGNVIQHLHEEIQRRELSLEDNHNLIAKLKDEVREKDRIIREQSNRMKAQREDLLTLRELAEQRTCPNLQRRDKERSTLRKQHRRQRTALERKHSPGTGVCVAQALSDDSDSYSEPEPGVSLARIGLPYQAEETCRCSRDILMSDSETEQTSYSFLECCSQACLSSGSRIIQGLVASILHQLDECEALDSGIEEDTSDLDLEDGQLSLCSSCTRTLPREFEENLHDIHCGLSHIQLRLQRRKQQLERRKHKLLKEMSTQEKDSLQKELDEVKEQLNNNYVLVAQLSSENLRILGENSKVEKKLEELGREKSEMMLKLEEEICILNSALADKEIEVESMRSKGEELEQARRELRALEHQVQELKAEIDRQEEYRTHEKLMNFEKSSPETSSSFDFTPLGGSASNRQFSSSDIVRPRAFSSCTQRLPGGLGRDKVTDVSSPDLGVDVESDPFSSLERGHKVGSLAFDKLVQENKILRKEKDVLGEKLLRSKAALQETLGRLSRSNIQKQDQVVSPAAVRRPPSRIYSDRGNLQDSPPQPSRMRNCLNADEDGFAPNSDIWCSSRAVSEQNFKLRKNKSSIR